MSFDLSKDLKKIFLAGVGAIAVTAEKSETLIKELIKKGELTVEQGKVLNEELKHDLCKAADACKNNAQKTTNEKFDLENMTKSERDDLKKRLDELEKYDNKDTKHA